jgi:hypothetical protein
METGTLLLLALLLVCPLTMYWLMRQRHGGRDSGGAGPPHKPMTAEKPGSGGQEPSNPDGPGIRR